MIIPGILFLFGLLCLIKGGDWFVDGASALARQFHLPELLIGATVLGVRNWPFWPAVASLPSIYS